MKDIITALGYLCHKLKKRPYLHPTARSQRPALAQREVKTILQSLGKCMNNSQNKASKKN